MVEYYRTNGYAYSTDDAGKKKEFYSFYSTLDIMPTGITKPYSLYSSQITFPLTINTAFGTTVTYNNQAEYDAAYASQKRFERLIEIISLRGQPIILGNVVKENLTGAALAALGIPAAGAGPTDIYSIKFAIEHVGAWRIASNNPGLLDTLDGVEGFVYTTPTAANNINYMVVGSL